jgi:uncharacterized membrane protein YjjP (DUF1212 family)
MELKFLDEKTTKSVRKFLAFGSGIVFFASCIYTMIQNSGPLDSMQYMIVAGIMGFYFGKNLLTKADVKVVQDRRANEDGNN